MNVPSTMMIENIAPSEATTLARDINGLHTFLTALPSNHPSYREFSLIIDQLQRDIAFYVSGEAQRAQISSIASMARDMESIIQDCFHNYGPAGIPTGKGRKRLVRQTMTQGGNSKYPEYSDIENRYRGFLGRIQSVIRKQTSIRKSPDVSIPGSVVESLQARAYVKLRGYRNELDLILSGISRIDKTLKPITRDRINTISSETVQISDTEGSEVVVLKQAIAQLAIQCLDGLKRNRDNTGDTNGVGPNVSSPKDGTQKSNQPKHESHKTPNSETELSPYSQSVVSYLEAFLLAIRKVLADGGSRGDGKIRQKVVSPVFRGLCDLIRRGTIDPTNFSWKEVLPQLGDTNDDYARTFKAVLARQETKTPFANNLMSFPALLSCITNNTVTIDTLTQSISTYLQENPPPTR